MNEPIVQLWTFRYWHPTYKNRVTLDCAASTVERALASARRFIAGENLRFRRAKVTRYIRPPVTVAQMKLELPS